MYAVRRDAARKWELAAYEVPSGREKPAVLLDVPLPAIVAGFSETPDGKSFLTSVYRCCSISGFWRECRLRAAGSSADQFRK